MNIFLMLLAMVQSAGTPVITNAVVTPPIVRPVIVPPIIATQGNWKTEPVVARFVPGDATCNGAVHNPMRRAEALPVGYARVVRSAEPAAAAEAPVELQFDIDSSGRPITIRSAGRPRFNYPVDTRDVAPAFSLWQFQPGAARKDCRISFAIAAETVARADLSLLYRYLSLQRPGVPGFSSTVGRAAYNRVVPAGSTCRGASNSVLEQHHPAFASIPQAPGTSSYAYLGFDIAADGSTRGVRVISSDGNVHLVREAVAALAKWRFAPGARTGCSYPYFRRQNEPVRAPEWRPKAAFAPRGARCGAEPAWVEPLTLPFPPQFNRRSIEGWAVIVYDVAPWGATGNVRILASEPAEQFGEQAASAIRRATKPASATGFTGCVQRLRFKIAPADGAPPTDRS